MYKIKRSQVTAKSEIDYYLKQPNENAPIVIFLHGYGETFGHILKHFEKEIPSEFGVLAINGVFPLPQKKHNSPEWSLRFCWYFYDPAKDEYFINQRYPAEIITQLICDLQLESRDFFLVGYSQGGYLAPFLGNSLKNVLSCISINAEYKHQLLPEQLNFPLINICGEKDEVVDPINCQKSHQIMLERGNSGAFDLVQSAGHKLNKNIINLVLNYINN